MLKFAVNDIDFYRKYSKGLLGKFLEIQLPAVNRLSASELAVYTGPVHVKEGVLRATCENRFNDTDTAIANILSRDSLNLIHDTSVSVGITSVELFERLSKADIPFKLTVSDKFVRYSKSGRIVKRVFDSEGNFVEGYLFSILGRKDISAKAIISKLLGYLLAAIPRPTETQPFFIMDQRLIALIDSNQVEFIQYDQFETRIEDTYDFVRCMNVLNRAYFSDEKLRRALGLLIGSLKDGGILQLGLTDKDSGLNHVAFYKKSGNSVSAIKEFNEGSSLKDIVDGI